MNKLWRYFICPSVLWFTFCCLAVELPELEPKYQKLFESTGPGHMWLAPDQQWLVMAEAEKFIPLTQLVQKSFFNAAGRAFHSRVPLERGSLHFDRFLLLNMQTKQQLSIAAPQGHFVDVRWSPDSRQLALVVHKDNKLTLWRYQVSNQQLTLWSELALSVQFSGESLVWLPDSDSVIVRHSLSRFEPSDLTETAVFKVGAAASQTRIYRDALDSDERRAIFRNLTLQQAVLIDGKGNNRALAQPGMLEKLSISPDGQYLLVQMLDENIQDVVSFNRMARRYQVVDVSAGKVIATPPALAAAVLTARQPDAAAQGARLLHWLPSAPASLVWVEAAEIQGHEVAAEMRDWVKLWAAPFTHKPELLFSTSWRLFQLFWTEQGRAVFSDFHAGTKQLRLWSRLPEAMNQVATLLHQYDYTNDFTSPGDLVTVRQPNGVVVAVSNAHNALYFSSQGHSAGGLLPYAVRYDAQSNKRTQIFSSDHAVRQNILYLRVAGEVETLLLESQSSARAPVLQLWSAGKLSSVLYDWHTEHLPVLPAAQELKYLRKDGVELSSVLYLPESVPGKKHPVLIWLYPREYYSHQKQQNAASEHSFKLIDPYGPQFALLEGFAVLDASNAPIVASESKNPNDSFVQQQQQNAEAMIAALQNTGVIDTSNMVLMGHSYGAFSALSLLATTDYFKGAIARSGAYNRSLTPLGFQSEKRTLWQSPELYMRLSPFFQADQIKAPVLLIHGTEDQNAGTSVLQSEMMFQALQAQSNKVELLLLPGEDHQYKAKENLQSMLQIQVRWLRQRL